VNLSIKRLEDASAVGLAAAELYTKVLGQFGGITSPLPLEPSAHSILSWLKLNSAKLPNLVGGEVDFGALSAPSNFSKMLTKSGCSHVEGLKEQKDIESPAELGETSQGILKSVWNFMKSF
jgi:hypothetical protein